MARKKSNAGRPSVVTKEAVRKLEEAFANGATDIQACFYANIGTTALYEYQKKNPKFTERKEGLKSQLGLISKNILAKAIKGGDANKAMWYLERKEKEEFSLRSETVNNNFNQDVPEDYEQPLKVDETPPENTIV